MDIAMDVFVKKVKYQYFILAKYSFNVHKRERINMTFIQKYLDLFEILCNINGIPDQVRNHFTAVHTTICSN